MVDMKSLDSFLQTDKSMLKQSNTKKTSSTNDHTTTKCSSCEDMTYKQTIQDVVTTAVNKHTTETDTKLYNDKFDINVEVKGLKPYGDDFWEIPIYFHMSPLQYEDLSYEDAEEFLLFLQLGGGSEWQVNREYLGDGIRLYHSDTDKPVITDKLREHMKNELKRLRPEFENSKYYTDENKQKHFLKYGFNKEDIEAIVEGININFSDKRIKEYANSLPVIRNENWNKRGNPTLEDKVADENSNIIGDTKIRFVVGPDGECKLDEHFIDPIDAYYEGISQEAIVPNHSYCTFNKAISKLSYDTEDGPKHDCLMKQTIGNRLKCTRDDSLVKNYYMDGTSDESFGDTVKFRNGVGCYDFKGVTSKTKQTQREVIQKLRSYRDDTFPVTSYEILSGTAIRIYTEFAGNTNADNSDQYDSNLGYGYVDLSFDNSEIFTEWAVWSYVEGESMLIYRENGDHGLTSSNNIVGVKARSGEFVEIIEPSSLLGKNKFPYYLNYTPTRSKECNVHGIHINIVEQTDSGGSAGYANFLSERYTAYRDDEDNIQKFGTVIWNNYFTARSKPGLGPGQYINREGTLSHELGHNFGLWHNHLQNSTAGIYQGMNMTNYLQGNNYMDMEALIDGPAKGFHDFVFDTPDCGPNEDLSNFTPNGKMLDLVDEYFPNGSQAFIDIWGNYGKQFMSGKPGKFAPPLRSGQHCENGGMLNMNYNNWRQGMYFSRDQGRIQRNWIAWEIPGLVTGTNIDVLDNLKYHELYVDTRPVLKIEQNLNAAVINSETIDTAHVKSIKSVSIRSECNVLKVMDQIVSQRTYSNVSSANRQYLGGWDIQRNKNGYLEMDPTTLIPESHSKPTKSKTNP